jgi:hypothetical protein
MRRKCGSQPSVKGATLDRNDQTLIPFTECFWTHDRANIGGDGHRDGDWTPVPFQLKPPSLGEIQEFQEGINHSAQYFPIPNATHETRPLEQVDLLGKILARIQ